jgi:hypothetical protein
MSLNPENLTVESFATSAISQPSIGGNTAYPICIVYVSDCVSCPPDQDRPLL